ncbi:acetyl-CoA acetyltransferase [Rhodococcus sp. USK13]|uniref:thiolase family protein n=1 Tax=Rhodococcus sp. USK13 TaxID=2806442 RepID=UPI001BCC4828|nr:acetyl-CoA acetyltransferase [Rhodococcus sp. USK13]
MTNEVVIVEAARSPLTQRQKYGRTYCELTVEKLLDVTVNGLLQRAKIDEDVVTTVITVGDGAASRRYAESWRNVFDHIDLHETISSTSAVKLASEAINDDPRRVVLVAGAVGGHSLHEPGQAAGQPTPRGADLWSITRKKQGDFAFASHRRARECALSGDFRREIIPLEVHLDHEMTEFIASDELRQVPEPRGALTPAGAPASNGGAGHDCRASHHNARAASGAGALVLTSAARADDLGLHPRGRLVGVEMLFDTPLTNVSVSQLESVRSYLRALEVPLNRIDQFEVPEEVAVTPLIWLEQFRLNPYMLNPRGGALAFGHLGGLEGIRCVTTMLSALEDTGGTYGVVATSDPEGSGVLLVECLNSP